MSLIDSTLGTAINYVGTASGVTIKSNNGSGVDTINVEGLDSLNASDLTITGDSNDLVTFQNNGTAMGASDLTVFAQTITVSSDVSSTDGLIDFTASRNIFLAAGRSLTTVDGAITLLANDGGSTTGQFAGIKLNSATISTTGTGNISLTGYGANSGDNNNYGIQLDSSSISSMSTATDAGTITLNGIGGNGTDNLVGVLLLGESQITSDSGDIQLTGQGGNGSGAGNVGVMLLNGSEIISTGIGAGAADITITGTGATSTFLGHGVMISGNDAGIQSVDGNISITGSGYGGSGSQHFGVQLNNSLITSTGTGTGAATITIDGTGGGGLDYHRGIQMADSTITTRDGDLTLLGQGGGNGTNYFNQGIGIQNSTITSTGTGSDAAVITLHGTGGSGTISNDGITLHSSTLISSEVADIFLTSEGNVWMDYGSTLQSDSGDISIDVNYQNGNNVGQFIMNQNSLVDAGSGNIDLDAAGDIKLTGLSSTAHVAVDSASGSILDNDDTLVDIIAATASVNAAGSIGTG
ncbi:MAG: hypothetical protein RLO18_21995, partial [Gimesia chilikensis]